MTSIKSVRVQALTFRVEMSLPCESLVSVPWRFGFCSVLSSHGEKHIVARWIKKGVGEVKLVDVKRSGLIAVECTSKSQMEKSIDSRRSGGCDGYVPSGMFVFHLARKLR